MDLLCKTRGNSSSVGKARVYFFSHPEDFNLFFNEICDDILDVSNCSIWYKKNPSEYIDSDFELTLGQMQLVVIPITSRLLKADAVINSHELTFIREKHIPILPLLQETNIIEIFNKEFNNVQFLSKFETDSTSISFTKKLEKFLNSVLLKDETINKISSEFDAHLFVSYRKKDRKFANEFMQLIHDFDEFEDIGIWYDEFLTPGENFNHEIEQAISKCDVFSVVFTPNIVNEINYIITTEYPLAKANKKYIFPAELVNTNKELVFETFKDMPQLVDVHNKDIFNESLKKILLSLNIKENDFSPEHKYLIGLAYLLGIDVEVNTEKGLKILKKCADFEYLPALEKLVDIYHRGHGVAIDYDKAIVFQDTIINIKKKTIFDNKIEEHLDYIESIYHCANLLIEAYKIDRAIELLLEAINLLKTIKESKLNETIFYYYNVCYNQLAFCYRTKKQPFVAVEYYKSAKELLERFYSTKKEVVEKYLSEVYNNLGTLFLEIGDHEYAKDYIESAFAIQNELFNKETNNKEESAYALVVMYNNLGAIADFKGEMSLEYYGKSIALLNQYLIDKRKMPYYRAAFNVHFRAGIRCEVLKAFEEANGLFVEALDYIEQVLKQSSAVEDFVDKANCYSHIAQLNSKQGKADEALSYYKKSIELLSNALSMADFPECRRSIHKANLYIASILLKKQMDKAESKNTLELEMSKEEIYDIREYYLRAIDIMQPLLEEYLKVVATPTDDGKVYISKDMVADIEDVADVWFMLSFFDKISLPVENGILMYSWLLKINPDNEEYNDRLEKLNKRLSELK